MLIFTHDKVRLEEHFRRDPVRFAYHLGDLDDLHFAQCQWGASYHKSTRIDECLLVYRADWGATVFAFGLSERFPALLQEALPLLPTSFYAHFFAPDRPLFEKSFREEWIGTGLRMKLGEFRARHDAVDEERIVRLGDGDLDELREFYAAAYASAYLDPRMLATGKYLGWREDGRLVGVAGVHVYAPAYRVAVLGSIATRPESRGRGISTRLTSRLTAELAAEGLLVCLNVMEDNEAAVRCYEGLGFERAFAYEESHWVLR